MRGLFENGCPYIEIGVAGNSENTNVRALIDTGYNGHLTLPYVTAFPLGLTLIGTESSRVADGTLSPYLACIGTVTYGEKRVRIAIDVQPSCNILLGTALLKELGGFGTRRPYKQ